MKKVGFWENGLVSSVHARLSDIKCNVLLLAAASGVEKRGCSLHTHTEPRAQRINFPMLRPRMPVIG